MNMKRLASVIVVLLLAVCWPRISTAGGLTLQWDPANDGITTGYLLFYGTASQSYSLPVDVGGATSYTLNGLSDGATYYFVVRAYDASGTTSDPSNEVQQTVPLFVLAVLTSGNPMMVCDGTGQGIATLTWTGGSGVTAIEIHLDSPTGPLFSRVGPNGSKATGKYMTEGKGVYLQNVSGGLPLTAANTLATATTHTTATGCSRSGTITATPNPISVCDGTGQGVTTLAWTRAGVAASEVHLDSPTGPLFSRIGPTGSKLTGKYMTEGRRAYLQDVSGVLPLTAANTLATVTVHVACVP